MQERNQLIHVEVTIENTKSNLTWINQSVAIYNKFLRGLGKADLLMVLYVFFLPSIIFVCHSAVIVIRDISLFINVNVLPRRNKEKKLKQSYESHK